MATKNNLAIPQAGLRPTQVRWAIMGWLTLVQMLTYLDRLNLSIAGKYIQDEFLFSTQKMGWIFSAFLLGYALCQIPGGWAGDKFGARNMLTAAILWWSAFTALTAIAPQLQQTLHVAEWLGVAGSVMIMRFLVGVGEAASAPNANKIVSRWMGASHRATGTSFTLLGIGLSGAMTPPLITWMMQRWGWRSSFGICGALGIGVAVAFYRFVTDRPEQNPGVNPAEVALIHAGESRKAEESRNSAAKRSAPWGKMLSSPSVWALLIGYFCQGYPIYIFHTWFFIYLVRVRGLSISQGGWWGATPYLSIAMLAPLGGRFSDYAVRKFGKRRGRQYGVWIGMLASAALLWFGSSASNRWMAIALLAASSGFNLFAAASFWATCIDLTQEFTASLSGLMNTFGNLGGWLSPILTAYIATHFGWQRALGFAGLVTLVSAICCIFVDASKPLENP
ncbi:MAG TPA: MFS transporter [Candidatus Acidoferrum sp.]|nr:MFS transporter [Candidatus Acidoferrum sp.]